MLVLDNSEWMRNGDYTPTRWEAQADAVSMIFDAKTNSNPESEVGLMTMAGKSPEVLVTLTQDIGKVLGALHRSKIVVTPTLLPASTLLLLRSSTARTRTRGRGSLSLSAHPSSRPRKILSSSERSLRRTTLQ